jgi:hypothetical protein
MTQFGTLLSDGTLTNVRTINQSAFGRCPFTVFDPSHYREDESCRCDDPVHRKEVMIKEWGYKKSDFKGIPLRKGVGK